MNSDGTYTYTPSLNYEGGKLFSHFKANDGIEDSNTGLTISITIKL